MSTTFVQDGSTIKHTAGSALSSGDPVELITGNNGYIGIAMDDIANGAVGELMLGGVHELTCLSTDTTTAGVTKVYWDSGNSRCTTTASTHTFVGIAHNSKANGDTTVEVKLATQPLA